MSHWSDYFKFCYKCQKGHQGLGCPYDSFSNTVEKPYPEQREYAESHDLKCFGKFREIVPNFIGFTQNDGKKVVHGLFAKDHYHELLGISSNDGGMQRDVMEEFRAQRRKEKFWATVNEKWDGRRRVDHKTWRLIDYQRMGEEDEIVGYPKRDHEKECDHFASPLLKLIQPPLIVEVENYIPPISEPVSISCESVTDKFDRMIDYATKVAIYWLPKDSKAEKLVYMAYIEVDKERVDYENRGRAGIPISVVREKVDKILQNRLVVGYEIWRVLSGLNLKFTISQVAELAELFDDQSGEKLHLKDLAYAFFDEKIHDYDTNHPLGKYDCLVEAKIIIKLYDLYKRAKWNENATAFAKSMLEVAQYIYESKQLKFLPMSRRNEQ